MNYLSLVQNAPNCSEETMLQAVAHTSRLIDQLWQTHQPIAARFIVEQYEIMYGPHFNEQLARDTVAQMYHDGIRGQIITPEESAPIAPEQPWDAYVAANALAHDLAPLNLQRKDLLQAAKAFWFHDQDFPSDNKIFWYFKSR